VDAADGDAPERSRLVGLIVRVEPGADALLVPRSRLRRRPWRIRRDRRRHLVQLQNRLLELDERRRAGRGNVARARLALPVRVVDARAVGVGVEGGDADLLRERQHLVLTGPGPLATQLGDACSAGQAPVEVAPADTPARLEHEYRFAGG